MPKETETELTAAQQAMLDLALACDLSLSDPGRHAALRDRRRGIRQQRDAAAYIREVEQKVHSRRRFRRRNAGDR